MRFSTSVLALLALAGCAAPTPSQPAETTTTIASPEPPASQPVVERQSGQELYARVCVTCHGATGDGKGLGQQLFSFGVPAAEWTNGPTEAGIMKTLSEGVHETSMQAFPDLGVIEQRVLAAYVLELRSALTAPNP